MNTNHTMVTEFILVGFSSSHSVQLVLFTLFLSMYIVTVLGNFSIVITYNLTSSLHTPMYFYLANFSFLEIFYITSTVPNMLSNSLSKHKGISFYGCATQMYCVLLLGGTECLLLAAMAYDRYNAICHPLQYTTIMKKSVCIEHIVASWVAGAVNSLVHTIFTFSLPFCKSNRINHFFCDVPPILKLSCEDTWANQLVIFVVSGCVIIVSAILTITSYIQIISTIIQIPSTSGRRKAFSTCTSHLIVVSIFYGSAIFMYFRPKSSYAMEQDMVVSLMYTVIAPLLNPFIYTLRNSEVKSGIKNILLRLAKIYEIPYK